MGAQIIDAVAVVDGAVRFHGIHRAKAVLHNEHGLFVPVVDGVQGHAQAHRVDGPAPLAGLEVRVLHGFQHRIAVGLFFCQDLLIRGDAAAGIVAEGDKIHGAFFQDLLIARLGV